MVSAGTIYTVAYVFLLAVTLVLAGDIVHHDDVAPTRPGCENNFVLVPIFFLYSSHELHINYFRNVILGGFDLGYDSCLLEQWGDFENIGNFIFFMEREIGELGGNLKKKNIFGIWFELSVL